MARPPDAEPEATRRRVLEAAVVLFAERGDSASLRDVAARAGVTAGTVQHYFGNKAGLKTAVEGAYFDDLADLRTALMAAALGEPRDPPAVLRRVVERAFAFVQEHLVATRLMMRQVVDTGYASSTSREHFLEPLLDTGSFALAALTGTSVDRARFALLAMNHLVIRFGLTAPDELVLVMGTSRGRGPFTEQEHSTARDAALAHLVDLFLLQCGVEGPERAP